MIRITPVGEMRDRYSPCVIWTGILLLPKSVFDMLNGNARSLVFSETRNELTSPETLIWIELYIKMY
jgi:hypothetical protein